MNKTFLDLECKSLKCNILVLHEDIEFSNKLKQVLEEDDNSVDIVNNLEDGYEVFEKKRFDYLILDLKLSNGEEDELIEILPKKMKTKMIIIAQDEDVQRREYLFSLGILDYFFRDTPMELMLINIRTLICKVEENHFSHILVIDEAQFSRKVLKTMLERRGYIVYVASSAKEGFEIMQKESIQMILVSYELLDMNGISVIAEIKKNPIFIEIPTIMLSSRYDKDIVSRSLKIGAIDFIKKPFVNEELLLKCDFHTAHYSALELMKSQKEKLNSVIYKMKEVEKNKSEFLSNMNHEIRTPLNAVIGFIDLLMDEDLNEKSKKYVRTIEYASKNLLRIVNDVLDFSKIESGKIEIEKIDFNIRDNCKDVINLFLARASEKNIIINLKIDENVPEYLKSDPFRIRQIVSNLLSNSIKFTPVGKNIIVRISYKLESLSISIQDEGIGIDKNKIDTIFDAFRQEDNSTTRKYGGTGLGLTISHKLVKLLGGELKVESELGKGSKFYFEIPAEIGEKQVKTKISLKSLNIKDKRILIAEDNQTNQILMKAIFEKLVSNFDIANDGIEAIELFNKNHYDLILMDENMPNISGIEATKKILEIEKEKKLKHTPIVALTGNALKGEKEKVLKIGMDDYMTKPLEINKLAEILSRFLQ